MTPSQLSEHDRNLTRRILSCGASQLSTEKGQLSSENGQLSSENGLEKPQAVGDRGFSNTSIRQASRMGAKARRDVARDMSHGMSHGTSYLNDGLLRLWCPGHHSNPLGGLLRRRVGYFRVLWVVQTQPTKPVPARKPPNRRPARGAHCSQSQSAPRAGRRFGGFRAGTGFVGWVWTTPQHPEVTHPAPK